MERQELKFIFNAMSHTQFSTNKHFDRHYQVFQ